MQEFHSKVISSYKYRLGTAERLKYAFGGLFLFYFLALRFLGALMQTFTVFVPSWTAIIAAFAGGGLFFVFAAPIDDYMKKYAYEGTKAAVVLRIICLIACLLMPYALLTRQVSGYGISLPYALNLCAMVGASVLLSSFILRFVNAFSSVFSKYFFKNAVSRIKKSDIIFVVSVFVILNVLFTLYCLNNKTIFFWDNAGFWLTAREMSDVLKEQGIIECIKDIYFSVFETDYNYIIAIPAILLNAAFGEARIVYIMGVANIYLFPLLICIYVSARKITPNAVTAWIFTVCFFPMLFYITAVGYIDVGAILCAFVAMMMYFVLKRENTHDVYFLLGALLALTMILRRWLVFFVISYIIAAVFDMLVYKRKIRPLIEMFCALAFCLLFVFQPYVTQKLTADYSAMYAGYDLGIRADFMIFSNYIGIVPLVILCIILIAGIIKKEFRQKALFALIQLAVCLFLFKKIQSHGEQHLMLYLPSLIFINLYFIGYCFGKARVKKVIAACAYAIFDIAIILCTTIPKPDDYIYNQITAMPEISCLPQKRYDTEAIVDLIQWLDKNCGEKGKKAAVAASSLIINREVLNNAENSLNIRRISDVKRDDYLMWTPQVDLRDGAPYVFFEADYVVCADPVQLHLSEENQAVINIPAQSFNNNKDIAKAFKKLDKEYILGWDGSVTVSVYEKVRPITDEEKKEFTDRLNEVHPGMYPYEGKEQ